MAIFKPNKNFLKDFKWLQTKALLTTWLYFETKWKEKVKDTAYDTWDYLRSINTKYVGWYKIKVWTNRIQAWIMEYWRKPWKFPNLDALVGWAWRHWFHTWWITKAYNELDSKSKGKVYVLARSISKKGIESRNIVRDLIQQENKNLVEVYRKYLHKYLK